MTMERVSSPSAIPLPSVRPEDEPDRPRQRGRGVRREGQGLPSVGLHLVLIGVALVAVYPFWWMIVAATRRADTILSFPPPLFPGTSLGENYSELSESLPFARAFLNSLFVAGTHTLLVLFFGSLAGYAFAKFDFPGRNKLFAAMLSTMMIPTILGIIPSFMLMRYLGWLDTFLPLIIPGAANAFAIFWMRQYIDSAVPDEILDSARIDGAGEFRIYWAVVLPLIRPALAALAIFTFMGKWNDFFFPLLVLREESKYTLPVALSTLQSIHGQQLGVQMLGAAIATLPVLIVFLLSARQFMAGLTAGALKG